MFLVSHIVDLAYGTGLLAFDEVCKRVEALALKTEDETRTRYLESQVRLHLFSASVIFSPLVGYPTTLTLCF